MKAFISLLILCSVLISCRSLPQLEPVDTGKYPDIDTQCSFPFLNRKYRLVHSIEAALPDGSNSTAIGVVVADPDKETIHVVIMAIEGVVLFDALYAESKITINRGVPPFDSLDFAGSLVDDIRLILFTPGDKPSETGLLGNGEFVCRYKMNDSRVIDTVNKSGGSWELSQYSCSNSLLRTVKASLTNKHGIPKEIELTKPGFFGYSLYLTLLEFEPVSN